MNFEKFNEAKFWLLIRSLLIVAGLIAIIFTFTLDRFGFGSQGSFGSGQVLLLIAGIFCLLAGLLGRKIKTLYRNIAIILLNTLMLFAILELAAIILARSGQNYNDDIQALSYYANEDWTAQYFKEAFAAEPVRYQPYVIWNHKPFTGSYMNLDQDGFRITPGAECSTEAYTVFVFGGSTILGWGSPDWGTIPAYLQSGLDEIKNDSVCVTNFGQSGYVSSQNLITLILQLQDSRVPDLVIFYDGVNEVQSAFESGLPGAHVNLRPIEDRFEQSEHPLVTFIKSTRTFTLTENWLVGLAQASKDDNQFILNYLSAGVDQEELATAVADKYLQNYELVEMLSQEYGFDFAFFLQPHLARGNKVLTPEEQVMYSNMAPAFIDLAQVIYEEISSAKPEMKYLWILEDSFDDEEQQIWIDTGGHVTPEGNQIVASKMMELISAFESP